MQDKLNEETLYTRIIKWVTTVLCIGTSLVYLYTACFGPFSDMIQRSLLITACGVVLFFIKSLKIRGKQNVFTRTVDVLFAVLFAATGVYIMLIWRSRILMVGTVPQIDIVMGTVFIILLLIVTRRAVGNFIVAICLILMIYALFGRYFPGMLAHRGVTWTRFVSFSYITSEGIFGTTAGTAASYIILFVTFGAFMETLGAGEWFVNISYALTGRYRGGPAKTAVISSALLGMISGSPAANVATTGTFTIPLMKKVGYDKLEAGAVEAVASTGGLFTPPVMGSAAFIMADALGIPFSKVALAAIVPAALYYLSLLLTVDSIAVKRGLHGLSAEELPSVRKSMRERGLFLIPILGLIVTIVMGWTITKAAFYAIVAMVIIAFLQKSTRQHPKIILTALKKSTMSAAPIIITCACAGIIVGAISLTGLGAKLSYSLITLAHGNPYLAAGVVMIVTLILGCAMPPTTVYIIVSAVLGNPLIDMGIPPLCAHMFIFIFSCVGAITPPVALAAFTAAGISGANANKTGFRAFRYGLMAFIIPFMFLCSPELLLNAAPGATATAVLSAVAGVICLVITLEGYFVRFWNLPSRIFMAAAALLLIMPGLSTDLAGAGALAAAVIINFVSARKSGKTA